MFPSILNTFNRPTATDRLNSPSHSALHNTVSSALGQVEATLGVVAANSVVGTLIYDVRSPASPGGGHVQGAAFGGTGQTNFIKGDILVASSASVLTKLAIGTDGQTLAVNSSTASGLQWGNQGNAESIIPLNAFGNVETSASGYNNSILASFGMVTLPLNILANSISIECTSLGMVGSAYKVAIYNESGQTRVASVLTSILGTGIQTRPISSIFFAAGNYWTCVVPVTALGSSNLTSWKSTTSPGVLGSSVAGKKKFGGVVSVTGGILPNTLNPASLTTVADFGVVVRLDT